MNAHAKPHVIVTSSRVGLLDYSPTDVARQMEATNKFLAVVNGDMQTDTKKSGNSGFYTTWLIEVYQPWLVFYKDFKSMLSGGASRFRDSTFKRAEAFRQLGLRYRENLQKKYDSKVTPTKIPEPFKLPKIGPLPDINSTKDSGLGIPWRKVLIVAGVGGAAYFGYKWYTSPVQRLKRLAQAKEAEVIEAVPPQPEHN
jgi:hypothetical protein